MTLSAGQAADGIVEPVLQSQAHRPDPLIQIGSCRGPQRPAQPPDPTASGGQRQVFGDRHRRGRASERILEDSADELGAAVFRRGGDVSFVVEELKAVFDPRGGQWMEGKYVPSLLAAIGVLLE